MCVLLLNVTLTCELVYKITKQNQSIVLVEIFNIINLVTKLMN